MQHFFFKKKHNKVPPLPADMTNPRWCQNSKTRSAVEKRFFFSFFWKRAIRVSSFSPPKKKIPEHDTVYDRIILSKHRGDGLSAVRESLGPSGSQMLANQIVDSLSMFAFNIDFQVKCMRSLSAGFLVGNGAGHNCCKFFCPENFENQTLIQHGNISDALFCNRNALWIYRDRVWISLQLTCEKEELEKVLEYLYMSVKDRLIRLNPRPCCFAIWMNVRTNTRNLDRASTNALQSRKGADRGSRHFFFLSM